ncbi:hypothetical protein LN565_09090 [Xanthomonas euvesicatoria pv. euvesicatoria]|uniref:Uncharacterized protein n=2 Tax=Xanthomonas TaxID=338 RepID=A0A6B3KNN1_XANEU|nr:MULTISPECIES: hypothetical protein [Xanthomonas]APO90857.1 hypothetical protein BJD11_13120 [Xanthomonas euvesicatoria]KLA49612.1 hypothetical protein XEUV683_21640 [Xanthomonas euvesicatoria]KLA49768.1 hypothetical protein XEUV685_22205 [Xanthomonas euvesicatoria]KLA51340.1 hypothetical protein XEUV684_22395 [Xanthomonas euvesicatoria]KLA83030.1 hypothetical protein XEUVL32_22245 [Xanthomonas euvesicatoria]
MITKDVELLSEILNAIEVGVGVEYDFLEYEVVVGCGYIDTALVVKLNGVDVDQCNFSINDSLIYKAARSLKEMAVGRGEDWTSFVISFKKGEQVKVNFNYE